MAYFPPPLPPPIAVWCNILVHEPPEHKTMLYWNFTNAHFIKKLFKIPMHKILLIRKIREKSLAGKFIYLYLGTPIFLDFFFFFCIFFWRGRVCRPLLRLYRPFMIFEGCLDSNPECCRCKLARYRLSHPSLYFCPNEFSWVICLEKWGGGGGAMCPPR